MISYNQLFHFIQVVQHKSISKAAEKMFIVQPAVSNSLKKIEQELNVKLFHQQNKCLELTTDGESVYRIAVEIVSAYKKLEDFSQSHTLTDTQPKSVIILATKAIHELFTPDLDLFEAFPNYQFIMQDSAKIDDLFRFTDIESEVIGIYFCTQDDFSALNIPDNFTLHIIDTHATCVLTSNKNSNPLFKQQYVKLENILDYPFIFSEELYSMGLKNLAQNFSNHFITISNTTMLYSALEKNPSAIALGANFFSSLSSKKLQFIPVKDLPSISMVLVYKNSNDQNLHERLLRKLRSQHA